VLALFPPSLEDPLEEAWREGFHYVAGCDEAGRGCLSGPVVAAAVVFHLGRVPKGMQDSKKLSADVRTRLYEVVVREAWSVGIGLCTPAEIDRLNILHASMEAMRRALAALHVAPELALIDGNRIPPLLPMRARAIVGGDARSTVIGAASIVAKVTRDRIMQDLHIRYPHFGWNRNAGYPTREHYAALAEHGSTEFHRKSYRLA